MGFKSLFKNTWYVYCGKKEIDPHLILIDTVNRGDLGGNLYRILLELLKPAYQDYKICIACEERVRERALRYLKGERNLRSLTGEEDFSEERVFFVTPGSFRYFTMTAAAGVIFMDVSGTRRFLRRPGQILVNTWHGTPLKRMGKDIPSGKHLIGNIQRNLFMCDYLCLPNLYTEEIFRDAYELRGLFQGTYVRAGYPRNQVFFDKKRQEIVRDLLQKAEGGEKEGSRPRLQKAEGRVKEGSRTELHRHGGEEAGRNGRIYVYMPTWRGSGNGKQMSLEDKKAQADRLLGYLREMDALLEKDEVLYIRLHPFVGQMISCDAFLHIREFPAELEPYEVLAAADCLVTDYSSVFYDYANKEDGKIVLFLYGREEYSGERDIYGKIGDLPFPAAENVPELICRMREPKSCDDRSFRGTYCAFDGPSSAEKIVKLSLMRSGTGNRKLSRDEIRQAAKDGGFDVGWEDTGGEKILFYLGGLKKNGMTASFLNLMDTLLKSQAETGRKDARNTESGAEKKPAGRQESESERTETLLPRVPASWKFYASFQEDALKDGPERLLALPQEVGLLPMSMGWFLTFGEAFACFLYYKLNLDLPVIRRKMAAFYQREYQRNYGFIRLSWCIHYNGYEKKLIQMFQEASGKRGIYIHSNMQGEIREKKNQHGLTLKHAYREYDFAAAVSGSALESARAIAGDAAKLRLVSNCVPYQKVRERSRLPLSFQENTRCSVPEEELRRRLALPGRKFMTIGRYSKEKNHIMMLKAFSRYLAVNKEKDQDRTQLILLGGEGGLYQETCDFVEKEGLQDAVTLILSMENPMPLLSCCDLFLLPSLYEGQPLVLLEAEALGVPSVATDVPGNREFMETYHGTLVPCTEEGILSGMEAFRRGEVSVLGLDFEEWNRKALSEFLALLAD